MEIDSPNKTLKDIRELLIKNNELLEEYVKYKRKEEKRRKWKIVAQILNTLAPFILTIIIAWVFYMKVQGAIYDFQDYLQEHLPKIPTVQEIKDSFGSIL